MSNNIEWGEISRVDAVLYDPGAFTDPFGNTNDELAMALGEGIVVEGTLEEWKSFAERLAASINAEELAAADAADDDDDEAEVAPNG